MEEAKAIQESGHVGGRNVSDVSEDAAAWGILSIPSSLGDPEHLRTQVGLLCR